MVSGDLRNVVGKAERSCGSAKRDKSSAGCCTLSSETLIPALSIFMRVSSSEESDFGKNVKQGVGPPVRVGLHELVNGLQVED